MCPASGVLPRFRMSVKRRPRAIPDGTGRRLRDEHSHLRETGDGSDLIVGPDLLGMLSLKQAAVQRRLA